MFCCWCSDDSLALSQSFPWNCCVPASLNSLRKEQLGLRFANFALTLMDYSSETYRQLLGCPVQGKELLFTEPCGSLLTRIFHYSVLG